MIDAKNTGTEQRQTATDTMAMLIFRPQACQDPALLERTLYSREKVVQMLFERVRDAALTGNLHQQLVYGPRGSGKTHVLTVVYNRLTADPKIMKRLLIARLAEEQWEIASFADMSVRILQALAKGYPDSPAAQWDARLRSIRMPTRRADAPTGEIERVALGLIQETIGEKALLIIAENLDDLFLAIEQEGQQKLRAQIQQHSNWILLASAQSLFAGVTSRSEPFFRFFQTHDLAPLDAASSLGFLRRLAGDPKIGDPALSRALASPEGQGRVQAIHQLCGGNHRLLAMLYPFLVGDGLADLVEPFMRMLDRELTPYYQERLRWLPSPQQRKIAAFLAHEGRPLTVKEVARGCFITEQIASKQLQELEGMGFVLLNRFGRNTLCEIREPLLRLVLELLEHRQGAVRTVIQILRAWYSPSELLALERSEAVRMSSFYFESVKAALGETRTASLQEFGLVAEDFQRFAGILKDGRLEDALTACRAQASQQGPRPTLCAEEALVLARLGRKSEAREKIGQAERLARSSQKLVEKACSASILGAAHLNMGDEEGNEFFGELYNKYRIHSGFFFYIIHNGIG